MSGMEDFAGADRSKVAVALIGKNDFVRLYPFHAGGDRGCSAVSYFNHVHIEIIISQYRTAYRSDADSPVVDIQFVNNFSD